MSTGVAQQIVYQKSMVDTATDDSKGIIPWGQRPAPTMPFSIDNIKIPFSGTADYGNMIYFDVPITAGDYWKYGFVTLTLAGPLAPMLANQPLWEVIEYMSIEFASVEIERFYSESIVAWSMICLTQEQKNLLDTIASTAGKVNADGTVSASIPLWLWFWRSPALACPLSPLYASPRVKIQLRTRENLPFVTAADGNDYVLTATGATSRNTPARIVDAEISLDIVLLPPAARYAVATSIREYLIEQSWRNDIRQFTRTTTQPRTISIETKENNPMKSRIWFTQRQARIRDRDFATEVARTNAIAAITAADTATNKSAAARDGVVAAFAAASTTTRWSSVYNAIEGATPTDVSNHLCTSAEIVFSGYPRIRVQPGWWFSQVQRRAAGTMGRMSNPTVREAIMQFHDALHPANPTQPSGSYNPMFTDKDTLSVTFPMVRGPDVTDTNPTPSALATSVTALQTAYNALSNAVNTVQTQNTAVTNQLTALNAYVAGINTVGGDAVLQDDAIATTGAAVEGITTLATLANALLPATAPFSANSAAVTALNNARNLATTQMTAAAGAATFDLSVAHLNAWLARARSGANLLAERDGSTTELTCRMLYFIIYYNVRRIGDGQMRNLFF